MKIVPSKKINDLYFVEIDRYEDSRGYFEEVFSSARYDDPIVQNWSQVNLSHSKKNVIRGIHCAPYQKLCTCVKGKIYDVAVDLRPTSATYMNWEGVWLSEDNQIQIFIPGGCGHGFYSDKNSLLLYLQNDCYRPGLEKEYHWDCFGINWPKADEYVISDRDLNAPIWDKI